jgi:CMP/dCMP kinase
MADLLITIDGPAGSGKSTLARMLAARLCAAVLDTGAMYRAVTLVAMQSEANLSDDDRILSILDQTELTFAFSRDRMIVFIGDDDVTETLREPEVTENVKFIASSPRLRARLVEMQREFALPKHKIITEGRDQGTVAFPDAHVKFFLTADIEERSRRRYEELVKAGKTVNMDQTRAAMETRDDSDINREVGPLKPADDAVIIDTTKLSLNQVLGQMLDWVEKKCFAQ